MKSSNSLFKWSMENDAPILTFEHESCSGKVSLYGGQVLSWQPKGHQEVFWLSNSAIYQKDKAIRGGVPLCWPWFGSYKGAHNHGFARTQLWQLKQITANDELVEIILDWQGRDIHPLWPHIAKLRQVLTFGESYKQELQITNLSEQSVKFTGALHNYFAVSSPEQCSIKQLSSANFYDQLTGQSKVATAVTPCLGPIDSIYDYSGMVELADLGNQRTIKISPIKTKQWVLWNPDLQIAEKIPDIHRDGESEFVCLEGACTEPQVIEAGTTVNLGQIITLENLC